jgi:hypothetical protein
MDQKHALEKQKELKETQLTANPDLHAYEEDSMKIMK